MVKSKKKDAPGNKKPVDERQIKISTFFGNKQASNKTSSLFTSIQPGTSSGQNQNSEKKSSHEKSSALALPFASHKTPNAKNDKENEDEILYIGSNPPSPLLSLSKVKTHPCLQSKANELESLNSQGADESLVRAQDVSYVEKKTLAVAKSTSSLDEPCQRNVYDMLGESIDNKDPTFNYKAQESSFSTPEKNIPSDNISESSPEIIFDTPRGADPVLEKANTAKRKKLFANRSFLRSSHLLGVQPGLKPAHLRMQERAKPRKSLGQVTISFKDKEAMSSTSNAEIRQNGIDTGQERLNDGKIYTGTHSEEKNVHQDINNQALNTKLPTDPDKSNENLNDQSKSCSNLTSVSENTKFDKAKSRCCSTNSSYRKNMKNVSEFASVPETQVLGAEEDMTGEVEEEAMDGICSENLNTSVFDQSSHQLELAVEKYLANIEDNDDDDSSKALCWDSPRTSINKTAHNAVQQNLKLSEKKKSANIAHKGLKDKDFDYGSRSRKPTFPVKEDNTRLQAMTDNKLKLLGALEQAEVTAKQAEGQQWLVLRKQKDLLSEPTIPTDSDDPTPTKVYPGKTLKIKRQAKPGMSPSSKRFDDSTINDLNRCHDRNLIDAQKVKKVLNLDAPKSHSTNSKPVFSKRKSSSFTRQRSAKFDFNPARTNSSDMKEKCITLADDDLLSDLLVDVNSPIATKPKSVSNNKPALSMSHPSLLKEHNPSTNNFAQKPVESKVYKKDEDLLNKLFGESILEDPDDVEVDELGLTNPPFVSVEEVKNDTPILIEDSQEDCIIINDLLEESNNFSKVDTYKSNASNKTDFMCEITADKTSVGVHECKVIEEIQPTHKDVTPTIHTNYPASLRKKTSEGPHCATPVLSDCMSQGGREMNSKTTRSSSSDTYLEKDCLASTDHSNYSCTKGNDLDYIEDDKDITDPCNDRETNGADDPLSTSMCDMLSDSFNDSFLMPAAPKTNLGFVFTDLWNRFTVLNTEHNRKADELILELNSERKHVQCKCFLQGCWSETSVNIGDTVNILTEFDDGKLVVNDQKGFIIVNPDLLLSGTLVVSAVFCPRKSVLNEQFKGFDKGNIHMLYGSIIHKLFQDVVMAGISLPKDIEALAVANLKSSKFLNEMYKQGVAENSVMEEIKVYVPSLVSWLSKYTTNNKTSSRGSAAGGGTDLTITKVKDIEENIWSPRLGIKGKIDMTIEAKMKHADASVSTHILPLELKTGKASFSAEHKGQVTLYSMMSEDRRDDPGQGILLYLKHGEMQTVPAKHSNKHGLIQLRNRLAFDLSKQIKTDTNEDGKAVYTLGELPPPINNERACVKCAHLQTCSIYQRSVEKTTFHEKHGMTKLVPEALQHLQDGDLSYFIHWMLCLGLEAKESRRKQLNPIWCTSSWQREKDGDCLSNMVITGSELGVPESQSFNDGKGCCLRFSRYSDSASQTLDIVGLTTGDMVVISSEDGCYIALATGFVRNICPTYVDVVVDRDFLHSAGVYRDIKFRLDRNSSFSTAGYLYTNMAQLMNPTPQGMWLRDLILGRRPPEFELKVSKACLYKVKTIFKPLNKPQRTAILKVLMAKDYVLIRGFPGTGKTATIVALVTILQQLGLSVLLTSYTHSAVDNILLKLKKSGVPFLRLGRQASIHPLIVPHCSEVLTSSRKIDSVQALKEFYDSYDIIATSCLSVSSQAVFSQRHFDVCIVDEASQVLQPACIGPLFYCKKFVLVGDPRQLPPVVQSSEARSVGMDESLFVKLNNRGATYDLDLQYRMNRVIMDLSNKLVYEGKLQCGDESVANQCLQLDSAYLSTQDEWIRETLDCDIKNSVVFVDIQRMNASEMQDGKGIKNETEADIVMALLKQLAEAKVPSEEIGVVSPYRSQVKLLKQRVKDKCMVSEVEVNTIDQYQGRDKTVILVSFVRSRTINAGELLNDLRRLNVALTRAKCKLILIGNAAALKVYPSLASIIQWLGESQNIVQVPGDFNSGDS